MLIGPPVALLLLLAVVPALQLVEKYSSEEADPYSA
jgi:hypothetical protein